tara:strand:+ start:45 stop:209 length:165 start_codon:yes stop_codon:yes gene_type:complete
MLFTPQMKKIISDSLLASCNFYADQSNMTGAVAIDDACQVLMTALDDANLKGES